jgi:hypothetical protein
MKMLQWLKLNHCPLGEKAFILSAKSAAKMEILEWLYEQGCPWNEDVCEAAELSGRIDILI